jgi:hypothetical protein
MSKTFKNLLIILSILTVAAGAYYLFSSGSALTASVTQSPANLNAQLLLAEEFVNWQRVLEQIDIDSTVLTGDEFRSLQALVSDPELFSVGRPDPFLPTEFEQANPVTQNER